MPLAEDYCQFHFQHHADKHSLAILGFVGDSATLLTSLAPFVMDVTIDVMLSLGVSPMLYVRWSALEKINQFWKVNSSSRFMDLGESGDNNEEVDKDMVDELNDLDSSFGSEPEFIYCCKSHLQEWRNAVVVELSKVQF
ncbi:hypothetical protein BT96DRAFT_941036 [Gymnopus androsaceus JB14]|uniref:Uncharacterized protein n=1 Tax=Gymnopus androsaceus JB14 TaxID=1447944 RepID=A0A6A4HI25_9AGAR|nr:hypothetical protein BT96DRAFT_941036 [Gymnopus androsaceus JB14]